MKFERKHVMSLVGLVAGTGASILVASMVKKVTPDDLKFYKKVAVMVTSATLGMAASSYVNAMAQQQTSETIDQLVAVKDVLQGAVNGQNEKVDNA